MNESDSYEEKSQFDWKFGQQHDLTKTIVAFANTLGGKIRLVEISCQFDRLDSAKIADHVEKYVKPPISGIESSRLEDGSVEILVSKSDSAPHIFIKHGDYKTESGKDKTAFHQGQVYVRRSSKTQPATDADMHRMVQEHVSAWLHNLGNSLSELSLSIASGKSGIPVSLSKATGTLQIQMADFNELYPYTATQLGQKVGKKQQWAANAAKVLGMQECKEFCMKISGKSEQKKYSDTAVQALAQFIKENPEFYPYHYKGPKVFNP